MVAKTMLKFLGGSYSWVAAGDRMRDAAASIMVVVVA